MKSPLKRGSTSSSSTAHVALAGSERGIAPGARALGAAHADEWVEVTVKLRPQKPLPDFSARPKTVMTREALAVKHGASAADIKKVRSALARYGLELVEANAPACSLRMGGPVNAMQEAFHVKLFHYSHERSNYRGRVGTLHVPAPLDGIVTGVFGLDTRRVVKQRQHALSPASATAAHRSWFFPAELARIYDFPPGDGAGQSIGLLEFGGGYFPSDLEAFCQAAGVAVPNVIPISVGHAPTSQHDGAEGEVMLDIEVVAGVCPAATIPVYFSHFTEQGWIDALDAAIHDQQNQPAIVSISWGYAEDAPGAWSPGALAAINDTLKAAALMGITVCVAAGDDGSDDQVGDGHAHVDFPSSSLYVLSVGGTTLRVSRGKPVETAWKDGDGLRKDGGGSTGGGVSAVFPRPPWQKVAIQSVNPGAIAGRCVPDVAADASAHTGYFMVVDGQGRPNGGTSAAAPLWASLLARINAALGPDKRAGYLTPLLYGKAPGNAGTVGSVGCKDITQGNNVSAAGGGYNAGRGYDAVTGWGSPLGGKLIAALRSLV